MSDIATQPEAVASAASAPATTAATKPEINIDLINPEAKAAIEAIRSLRAGAAKKYTGTTVEECFDQGIVMAAETFAEKDKKNLLTGTSGDIISSVAGGGALGFIANAVTRGSEAKGTIDMVKNAQAQVDTCIGEAIESGSISAEVFKNRKPASTAGVGVDAAQETLSTIPFVGGMFGGGKKKEAAPAADTDTTKVDMKTISTVLKKGAAR